MVRDIEQKVWSLFIIIQSAPVNVKFTGTAKNFELSNFQLNNEEEFLPIQSTSPLLIYKLYAKYYVKYVYCVVYEIPLVLKRVYVG